MRVKADYTVESSKLVGNSILVESLKLVGTELNEVREFRCLMKTKHLQGMDYPSILNMQCEGVEGIELFN